ncbi:MAG: bifunctional methionine sulfoxide reductase B/A protein [Spirochaetota bacterium]
MSDIKLDKDKLKEKLSAEEYRVICENGTEPPFHNAYWDNHREGIYVDRISGEPLFSSADKFDSGTGWPSFSSLLDKTAVRELRDESLGSMRTEVRSSSSDAHLGHLFADGPRPTGLRYCMNSASLRFIPKEDLEKEGYEKYLPLFEKETKSEEIILAGGCFWGVEEYFSRVEGVLDAVSGYTGGRTENPSYEEVCTGLTGHAEAVKITFNPAMVSLAEILAHFWNMHDPASVNRQGNDIGSQYRSAVFYHTDAQREIVERSVKNLSASGKYGGRPVVTEIVKAGVFYTAEEYHQEYLKKNPRGYCHVDLSGAKKPQKTKEG